VKVASGQTCLFCYHIIRKIRAVHQQRRVFTNEYSPQQTAGYQNVIPEISAENYPESIFWIPACARMTVVASYGEIKPKLD